MVHYNDISRDMPEIGKNDAAVTTVDTYVSTRNTEPPMAPSNSALKTGLDSKFWSYIIVISTCYVIILLGGAMSAARWIFLEGEIVGTKKILRTGRT